MLLLTVKDITHGCLLLLGVFVFNLASYAGSDCHEGAERAATLHHHFAHVVDQLTAAQSVSKKWARETFTIKTERKRAGR